MTQPIPPTELANREDFSAVGRRLLVADDDMSELKRGRVCEREIFRRRLGAELAREDQPGRPFAVLVFGLDRFRMVNDSLGRSRGDEVLTAVGGRLAEVVGELDVVGHLGGDEFAVMVTDCRDAELALRHADRFQRALEEPFRIGGQDLFVSASVGIVLVDDAGRTPESCLRDADTAAHRAKKGQGSRRVVFEPEMRTLLIHEQCLEHDLPRALARDELEVHYQPIVRLHDGLVDGFEALVRWRHPQRGLLHPGSFIPIAERTGLIVPIGWKVLEAACRQLSSWHTTAAGSPFVSVNVCGRQLMQADAVTQVEQILGETRCPAASLRLELTETMLMENAELGVERLTQLADLDIQLYIDDFGTGYSSLSYLYRLPAHAIKIDRSFVSQLTGRPEIVAAVLGLARSLDMRVEAEGVENSAQRGCLLDLGCQFGQGFYFSKAVSSRAATALVGTRLAG